MNLLELEQQCRALEENLQALKRDLKYWQTFEAEYEGLKEEIQEAQPNVDGTKLSEIAKTYNGELVTEQVVRELAGLDKRDSPPRSGPQITRDIERRQEYVQKNVETIQRRFFEAESKLEEFDFVATREVAHSGGALPLTEILEELDDDDNVISTRLSQPEVSQSALVESLRKAGLTDEDLAEGEEGERDKPLKPAITNASLPPTPAPSATSLDVEKRAKSTSDLPVTNGDSNTAHHGPDRPSLRKKSVSFAADTKAAAEAEHIEADDGRKSVSFADKVAIAPAAPPPDTRTVQFSPTVEEIPADPFGPPSSKDSGHVAAAADSDVQRDLRASFKPGDKVKLLNDDDEVIDEHIVVPENESEEDAQIRREMLDYHLNEVGHVVAQMDMDDNYDDDNDDDDDDDDASSHFTTSTYLDDEDTPYTSGLSDDDEDDDEYGRTKHKVISDDYRKQMMDMEKRLIGNLGPAPKDEDVLGIDPELNPQDAHRLVIREKGSSVSPASSDSSDKKAGGKKRVSFAESLDVAEPSSPPLKTQKSLDGGPIAPVSDLVSERSPSGTDPALAPGTSPAISRFKRARSTPSDEDASIRHGLPMDLDSPTHSVDDAPTGPPGRTLAENLIERPPAAKLTIPPSADDLDPITERRQLAAEYYRRRNEMIKQQGGFKVNRDEDEALGELMEERPDGKLKKVSRFKAARINPPS